MPPSTTMHDSIAIVPQLKMISKMIRLSKLNDVLGTSNSQIPMNRRRIGLRGPKIISA